MPENEPATDLVNCQSCFRLIPERASVCHFCQRSQSRLRNEFIFAGSIVGFVTLLLSGFSYLYSQFDLYFDSIVKGDKFSVQSFMVHDDAVLYNAGFRLLNVLQIQIELPELNRRSSFDVYKAVRPGEIVRFRVGRYKKYQMLPNVESVDIEAAGNQANTSVIPVATVPDDPDYVLRKSFMESDGQNKIRELKCSGKIIFVPAGQDQDRTQNFDCLAFLAAVPSIAKYYESRTIDVREPTTKETKP